uniref:Fibroblast growth factor receptor 2 n=1 Tax=Cacopsylla melanoneura TaxID=428564 RepID=A0A8D8UER9_9HEMI
MNCETLKETIILIVVIGGICIVVVLILILRRKKETQLAKTISIQAQTSPSKESLEMPIISITKGKAKTNQSTSNGIVSEYEVPRDNHWEFPRQSLTLGQTLGEGNFDKVVRAEAEGILKSQTQ